MSQTTEVPIDAESGSPSSDAVLSTPESPPRTETRPNPLIEALVSRLGMTVERVAVADLTEHEVGELLPRSPAAD